jgi:hypothetical protein
MKKITAFLTCVALAITMFAWSEQAHSNLTRSSESEKIYITPGQLHFDNNNIYVLHNNDWLQVNALYSDGKDLFIERKQPSPETWYCSVCRTYHSGDQKCPQER